MGKQKYELAGGKRLNGDSLPQTSRSFRTSTPEPRLSSHTVIRIEKPSVAMLSGMSKGTLARKLQRWLVCRIKWEKRRFAYLIWTSVRDFPVLGSGRT